MKPLFVKVGLEELKEPAQSQDLKPTEHVWDELECQLQPRTPEVPEFTNALVAKSLIPTTTRYSRKSSHNNAYECYSQLSTNSCPYSVL